MVLRGVVVEGVVRDGGDHLLHLRQVLGPADHRARVGVAEDEVAESELGGDVVVELGKQRLGVLGDESGAQRAGLGLELHLRRL